MKTFFLQIFNSDAVEIEPLSGGDINQVFKVRVGSDDFAVKVNDEKKYPNMFLREAEGLKKLASANTISIPEVVNFGAFNDKQYLVLEYIPSVNQEKNFWRNFGRKLAQLHQNSNAHFGLENDNYIGSLRQKNSYCSNWEEFYISQRLEPMIKLAFDSGFIGLSESKKFNPFMQRIADIYPEEAPSLLHGDLWSGNYMVGGKGEAVLIDPAIYFGHREIDLGMMHLFGGFDSNLFEAYNEEFPLEINWQDRINYNQIYPLMVHVNLFGRSYWGQVEQILRSF